MSELLDVPPPGGDRASALVGLLWEQFSARRAWPTWAEVDHLLYRSGMRSEDALAELAPGLVSGIDSRGQMLPSANQSIRLTIGGIANCPTGGDHVRTFLSLVQYAVQMEREWDYSTGEQPRFSFGDVSRAVALPIGTVGETLARQVLSVIDVEPWLGGYGGEDDDRKFVIGRPIRDFAGVKTISEYWRVREARTRPAYFEPSGTPAVVQTHASPPTCVSAGNRITFEVHPLLKEALWLFEHGRMSEAADNALRELEARINSLTDEAIALPPSESFGQRRITAALKPDPQPILNVSHADAGYDRGEQDGMKFLFMGVYAGLRNPIAHRKFRPSDSAEVAEILGVVSMCLRRLDTAEMRLVEGG